MDSLTQIVLGAATAEAVAGKKLGDRAILYGAILGTIPDLDVAVGRYYDIVTANELHRGFSHSIAFFLLASPLFAMLTMWMERKRGLTFRDGFLMSFLCLFTHALLDAFTNWGTQLFWPFEARVAIQSIFVIDPLYTLPFIFCLIIAMCKRRTDPLRWKWNWRGIAISSSYLILTVAVQTIARNRFEKGFMANHDEPYEISVRPAPLQIILWNANIRTADGYYLGEYSFFDSKPISYKYFAKNEQLLGDMRDAPVIERLKKMSEGWYAITKENADIYFNDLRFGLISAESEPDEFVFRYKMVRRNGEVIGEEAESPARRDTGKLFARLWRRIKGN